MKKNVKTIEKRIVSVQKIAKLTKAMKIIATINFQKAFKQINANVDFLTLINQIYGKLQCLINYEESVLTIDGLFKKQKGVVWIVFTSDFGFCGIYNKNLFQMLKNYNQKKDYLIVVGKKGMLYFQHLNISVTKHYLSNDFITNSLTDLVSWIKNNQTLFVKIMVVYTHFISFLHQTVKVVQLLPVAKDLIVNPQTVVANFVTEPSGLVIYQNTLEIYLNGLLLCWYWNAKTSEEKIRQITMDSASDNAQDMVDDLKLQYNQLRQEKITKEVILVSQDT